jgi:hypothetical protein
VHLYSSKPEITGSRLLDAVGCPIEVVCFKAARVVEAIFRNHDLQGIKNWKKN